MKVHLVKHLVALVPVGIEGLPTFSGAKPAAVSTYHKAARGSGYTRQAIARTSKSPFWHLQLGHLLVILLVIESSFTRHTGQHLKLRKLLLKLLGVRLKARTVKKSCLSAHKRRRLDSGAHNAASGQASFIGPSSRNGCGRTYDHPSCGLHLQVPCCQHYVVQPS